MSRLYKVKAHAGSREDRLLTKGPDAFEVWVRAPAEGGRANAAILALLAPALGVELKRLRVMKGASSPAKLVAVLGT